MLSDLLLQSSDDRKKERCAEAEIAAGPRACQAVGNLWLTGSSQQAQLWPAEDPHLPLMAVHSHSCKWSLTPKPAAMESSASGGSWQAVDLEYQFPPGRAYVDKDPTP